VRVVILSKDVIPGMGVPVAAPGLRTWGMALGLRALGHEVTILIDHWLVSTVWRGTVPPPMPRGSGVMQIKRVADYVRTHAVDAVVITNSTNVERLGDLGRCRVVCDFFAPKMLELSENVEREDLEDAKRLLTERKVAALARSDAVAVNGAKKLSYVREWLARSGVPDLPIAVVNPGLPHVAPRAASDGPLQAVVSGYLQPWSRPGAWAEAALPVLDSGEMTLHLMVGEHWGQRSTPQGMPEEMRRVAEHPAVVTHGLLRFGDFRDLLARCHLSIDVFDRNPERELAMVTRSVVALSCGLPVLHVPFTEVSPWIQEYGAGWLVEEHDVAAMHEILSKAAANLGTLDRPREGAVAVSEKVLDPAVAASPLADLIQTVVGR
jgi:hypothetical protein